MRYARAVCITPRRLGLALCLLGFIWAMTLMNLSLVSRPDDVTSPDELRGEILLLSEKYVRSLARDTRSVVDGPYAGRLTGYDLKKTVAVLLENLLDRVHVLEDRVDRLSRDNRSAASSVGVVHPAASLTSPTVSGRNSVNARDLLLGAQEDCGLTVEESSNYPHCTGKMNWMKTFWKSDKCYVEYGVDGSLCSFRYYLSEVESWCPPLRDREAAFTKPTLPPPVVAQWNFSLAGLLDKLRDPGQRPNYDWIRQRISRTWPMWLRSAMNLASTTNPLSSALSTRHRKRILVHLGLLSSKSGFHIPELAEKGGPLGELVQWSDIISSLYILGHELTITSEVDQLSAILDKLPSAGSQCQVRSILPVDMIYTDIVGLIQFKRKVRTGYAKFSCLLRIIDSFGTEPAFNYDVYAKAHHLKTQWGMQNLNPQQFFTMFPHSPDNSFMGFVVEHHVQTSTTAVLNVSAGDSVKKNQAVVYGKAEYMWSGKESYLSVIKRHVDIHATVFLESGKSAIVPQYVTNHGILSGPDVHELLHQSKLFVGLGFPYEGPAPLEAIAQGCVFINPKFSPAHSALNTKFFSGKPTHRQVTSQHPYAEDFIGEPHVYTVNMDDKLAVESAVQKALKAFDDGQVKPYLPFEMTHDGMLLRLSAYIQHQDFCSPKPEIWPPLSSVKILLSQPGQSCKDACWANKMICEPSHLKRLNARHSVEELMKSLSVSSPGVVASNTSECLSVDVKDDIYFPAFEPATRRCFLQKETMLYSCVGEVDGLVRLCPCRDYIRGQTALCSQCL